MKNALFVAVLCTCSSGCGPSSALDPSRPLVSLTGTVFAGGGSRVPSATVTIVDGTDAGRSAITDGTGEYRLDRLTPGNATLSATASGFQETRSGVFINGANTLDFTFPIRACETDNTATVSFGNRSTASTHDIVWDGSRVATLAPGQTSDPMTVVAGVEHMLQFLVADTTTPACAGATAVPTRCGTGVYTCSGPAASLIAIDAIAIACSNP
jgi:hypothetical protein